ncbi:MAG: TIGR02710 family CRISPR-associated protein [Thermoplasmatales archaeon]|nr:TIGR02710 family CRISPR-associated protein [Thermoplasmatales archaeon]
MRILFITVGTGVGESEEKVKSLAHGILYSISQHKPDKIVFFGSEESKRTIEEIKKQYLEKEEREFENYEFVKIDKIDDFNDCYEKMENKIKEYKEEEIVVDYTSGTKTMTTTAAIIAMLYQKKLFLTSGKRGKNGIVIPGTEEIKQQNLYLAYNKYALEKAKEAFNSYRYEDAKNYLKQIVAMEEKKDYEEIVEAYSLWDKFEHEKAKEKMEKVKMDILNTNKSFLGRLGKAEVREEFLIPDLLNNASRRIEEGKYDDAVARLYRVIEMIAQYRLKAEHDLNPSEIKWGDLEIKIKEQKIMEKYEKKKDEKGIIRLSLNECYDLLKDLNDEVGKVAEDKELKDLLKKRNFSILAHGVEPVSREGAYKLFNKAKEIAEKVLENLNEYMEISKFPKL